MKLNELVCPSCGLKCMVSASYTTCASCNTFFYANQSRSVDQPTALTPGVTITWPTIVPTPNWPWASPFTSGGYVTVVTDPNQYQVFQ
jgi:hypothetical protein